jgi:hypothetical protein
MYHVLSYPVDTNMFLSSFVIQVKSQKVGYATLSLVGARFQLSLFCLFRFRGILHLI